MKTASCKHDFLLIIPPNALINARKLAQIYVDFPRLLCYDIIANYRMRNLGFATAKPPFCITFK